jgi:hypothetical protein
MKIRLLAVTILTIALFQTSLGLASAKTFKNCTELNKTYPGGVAFPGAVNQGGMIKLTPKYNKKIYEANKKSDRDKVGIACEK